MVEGLHCRDEMQMSIVLQFENAEQWRTQTKKRQ
jgi:hypothetical protein